MLSGVLSFMKAILLEQLKEVCGEMDSQQILHLYIFIFWGQRFDSQRVSPLIEQGFGCLKGTWPYMSLPSQYEKYDAHNPTIKKCECGRDMRPNKTMKTKVPNRLCSRWFDSSSDKYWKFMNVNLFSKLEIIVNSSQLPESLA